MSLGILEEAGQHPPQKYGITYPLFCGSLTAAQASPACFVLTRWTVMGRRMDRCIQAAPESKDHRSSQVTASRSRSSQARWQVIPTVLGKDRCSSVLEMKWKQGNQFVAIILVLWSHEEHLRWAAEWKQTDRLKRSFGRRSSPESG